MTTLELLKLCLMFIKQLLTNIVVNERTNLFILSCKFYFMNVKILWHKIQQFILYLKQLQLLVNVGKTEVAKWDRNYII